jgi:hypothetical protein
MQGKVQNHKTIRRKISIPCILDDFGPWYANQHIHIWTEVETNLQELESLHKHRP